MLGHSGTTITLEEPLVDAPHDSQQAPSCKHCWRIQLCRAALFTAAVGTLMWMPSLFMSARTLAVSGGHSSASTMDIALINFIRHGERSQPARRHPLLVPRRRSARDTPGRQDEQGALLRGEVEPRAVRCVVFAPCVRLSERDPRPTTERLPWPDDAQAMRLRGSRARHGRNSYCRRLARLSPGAHGRRAGAAHNSSSSVEVARV